MFVVSWGLKWYFGKITSPSTSSRDIIIFPQYHFKPRDRNIPWCSPLRKSPPVYCRPLLHALPASLFTGVVKWRPPHTHGASRSCQQTFISYHAHDCMTVTVHNSFCVVWATERFVTVGGRGEIWKPQTSDGSPLKVAASTSDVNVKEGKKGKESTELEWKLAISVGEGSGETNLKEIAKLTFV